MRPNDASMENGECKANQLLRFNYECEAEDMKGNITVTLDEGEVKSENIKQQTCHCTLKIDLI